MKKRYMLIFVDCNEIHYERFDTLEDAQEKMRKQIIKYADLPKCFFGHDGVPADNDVDDFFFGSTSAYAHDISGCHYDYDWLIVDLEEE